MADDRSTASRIRWMKQELKATELFAIGYVGAMLLLILLYAAGVQFSHTRPPCVGDCANVPILGLLLGVMFAGLAGGGFLGFLFGIPRLLQGNQLVSLQRRDSLVNRDKALPPRPAGETDTVPNFSVNTNLEEISDWLTKIIVGLTLVQFSTIYDKVTDYAHYFGDVATQKTPGASAMFLLLLTASVAGGFLFVYLQTRTRVTLLLVGAEWNARNPAALVASMDQAKVFENLNPIDLSERSGGPAPQSDADRAMLRYKFEDLQSPAEYAAWAAANVRSGNATAAVPALEFVATQRPQDQSARLALAAARKLAGDPVAAARTVQQAVRDIGKTPPLLRNLAFTSLYRDPPESFTRALEAIEELFAAQPEARNDPEVHVWKAAANGQKYAYGLAHKDKALMDDAREGVIKAVNEVKKLETDGNRTNRIYLKQMLDPKYGGSPVDRDLVVFAEDPEIRKLIEE